MSKKLGMIQSSDLQSLEPDLKYQLESARLGMRRYSSMIESIMEYVREEEKIEKNA